jgi:hypothetical protein
MISFEIIDFNEVKHQNDAQPPQDSDFGNRVLSRLAITLFSSFLLACTNLHQSPDWSEMASVTKLEDEQTVRKEYGCNKRAKPFLTIERHGLSPDELQAGQEFQHRFLYAACLPGSGKSITGFLSREIFFQGKKKPIFKDVSKNVEIKPGRWADVATIKIPAGVELGDYYLHLTFSIPNAQKRIGDLPFKIIKKP